VGPVGTQRATARLVKSVLILRVTGAPRRTRRYTGDESEAGPSVPRVFASAFSSHHAHIAVHRRRGGEVRPGLISFAPSGS
jgi:hypothetical protein